MKTALILAAALIVPSIAVVLVNAGAALLVLSGSPVVLPAIALVVAVTLRKCGKMQKGNPR